MRDLMRRAAVTVAAVAGAGILAACATAGATARTAAATTVTATTTAVALPANAGPRPDPNLTSVSCVSAGHCIAVGDYTDSSGPFYAGLLAAQTVVTARAAGPPGPT